MSNFRRCFTKEEAEVIKPYIKYFSQSTKMSPKEIKTIYEMMIQGYIFRTPTLREMSKNFKDKHPDEKLPAYLKL